MKKFLFLIFTTFLLSPLVNAQDDANIRSSSIVSIGGDSYYVHTVKRGETIYSLSRLYGVTEEELKNANPQVIEGLQTGHTLKVPVVREGDEKLSSRKLNKIFDVHTVNQGETLYSISRRYEIPVNTLLEDNEGLDPAQLSIGQRINIRKKSKGEATPREIENQMTEYRDAINSVSADAVYHLVKRGETLYSISRQYGVTEEEIGNANDLREGLKAGAMIRIPMKNELADVNKKPEEEFWVKPDENAKDTSSFFRPWESDERPNIKVKDLSGKNPLYVSVLLPLKNDNGQGNRNYLEFYQGFLLGLEDAKAEGVNAEVSIYNTSRSLNEIYNIVESPDFTQSDIVVGPVYEESIAPVIEFANRTGAAVVSPLAAIERESNSLLYQMAPDPENRYDKLKQILTADKNIVYISTANPDADLDNVLKPFLPQGTEFLNYSGNAKTTSYRNSISKDKDNVFVVSCTNELVTEQVLAAISSTYTDMVSRGAVSRNITVIGSSRWGRFRNSLDKNLFFTLNVCYVSPYHADRSDLAVNNFYKRYVSAYNGFPSLYSYRGYDVAKLFLMSAVKNGSDLTTKLNIGGDTLLQMPYHFMQKQPGGTFINDQWALVCYKNDYTIEVR